MRSSRSSKEFAIDNISEDTGIGSWGPRVFLGLEAEARLAFMHREEGMWMISPDKVLEGGCIAEGFWILYLEDFHCGDS